MLKKKPLVTFAETPATVEEKNIIKTFERFASAIIEGDNKKLADILTSDALMRYRPGPALNRSLYLEEMKLRHDIRRNLEYHNLLIRKTGATEWLVHGESHLYLKKSYLPAIRSRYFKLVQINGNFFIKETGFI